MNDYPNDWLCAQHEAAHALLAHLLGGEVLEVTLRRTTYVEPRDYHDRLLITLAGWALSLEGTGADLDAALSLYQRWQSLRPMPLAPFHVCLPQWLAECRTWLLSGILKLRVNGSVEIVG